MFQMMGIFAEFERAMIRDRIKAGISRAKAQGKRLGRPRISPRKEKAIRTALMAGTGIRKTASQVGTGVATVQRIKAELAAA